MSDWDFLHDILVENSADRGQVSALKATDQWGV